MEQENGKIIEGEIHYPSHFGEVYDAMYNRQNEMRAV